MFKRLSDLLFNQALRTTSAHLSGERDRILEHWLAALVEAVPSYRAAKEDTERWGRGDFSLLLRSLAVRSAEEREELHKEVVEMGRRVAKYHLDRQFALEDILRAYGLLRLAVLNEVERMLRRRLWLAFPPDILKAEDRINEAIDMQMLVSAQWYVRTRDEEIRRGQMALEESNYQLLRLIQEMHHRIKNNLQTVADLLSLEILQGAKTSAEDRLRESILRVKSIAAVHELLSLDNTELTDIHRLAKKLVDACAKAMVDPHKDIKFAVEGSQILLGSKQATALALVMNELINNAVEHAFKGRRQGIVVVKLTQIGSTVEVLVQDDGVGLPDGFGSGELREGLGLQIARTMVAKDLAGTLELMSRGGTTALVRFKR